MKKLCFSRLMVLLSVLNLTACVTQKHYLESDKPVVENISSPEAKARARIKLGLTYLQKGDSVQAKFNLDKALEFAPDLAEAHYSLAYYYQTVQNFDKAEKAYIRVIELSPNNGDAYNNYGAFLCERGRLEEATENFLEAVKIDSYIRVWQTYENLGLCLADSGQESKIDQAISYFNKALGYNARAFTSLNSLIEIYQNRQEWHQVKAYFDKLRLVSRPSAALYWLGYNTERNIGAFEAAKQYGRLLLIEFPSSSQTQLYKKSLLQ
ncbi:type IV pilus biogenesis/stability protein PilW [Catenovulum maritimum]|uniref:Uncharacterized protein n=1 Tax=Catenovulum maritimum TaxID=1513271 RepID=A0A0J8GTZ1_9ALTE|nr:type IV pilus biogenesis/stability protein PilW [Catenovulum maritimum]KMT64784.1 hypothetical protein XM47_13070 [Catenovulum maritimum]